MDNALLKQPKRIETSAAAKCSKCQKEVYTETLVEKNGVLVERVVVGSFRQALDADGMPNGPVIPFCICEE